MAVSVECTTKKGVLNWYQDQEHISFVIYRGIKEDHVSCQYIGSDAIKAEQKLESFCNDLEPSNENIYYIKLQGTAKSKENLPGLIFCLNVKQPNFNQYPAPLQYIPAPNDNNEILSRLAAIESNLENEVDEEQDQDQNFIGSLLKEPAFKNLLISGIGSILANIITPASAPLALAGIPENEESAENLQKYISTLFEKGVTITDLKTLSEKSENELNMLLSILRK